MKNVTKIVLLILLPLLMTSCRTGSDSTTTGNPFVSLSATGSASVATVAKNLWQHLLQHLAPRAHALPPPATMSDAGGNTVTLTSSWYTIGEIEFKFDEVADGSEMDGDSVEFQGPYTIDLFSSTPQNFASGYIATTQIRRVKIKLKKTLGLPAGAPADLLNRSLYFSGTVNGHSLTYYTEEESVMEVAGPNLVNAVNNSELLLEFRTANLVKRINFSAITTDVVINQTNRVPAVNPCPLIEPSASDLFTCLRKGLETESSFGRDEDGDDQLDLNEESVD